MNLSIFLFGSLSLQRTQQNSIIPSPDNNKAKALLAYLATPPHKTHQRSTLATLLWPEQSDAAAKNNLRQTLHRLRKSFATTPLPLHISRQTIQFSPEQCQVDVQRFQQLWQTHQPHPHQLEEIIALYRGPFLQDILLPDCPAYDQWLRAQEAWFHDKTQLAYQHLVQHHTTHQPQAALAYCRRWVALDPYNEKAQRQLIQLLAHNGQRGLAMAQYEQLRQLLATELQLTPTAETQTLYQTIKQGHIPTPSTTPTYHLSQPPTTLLGRQTETNTLAQWLATPTCRLITIASLPGNGASTLAIETARAHAQTFPHGILHIPLRHARTPTDFWQACATALNLPPQATPNHTRQQILATLAPQQCLLILDDWHTPTADTLAALAQLRQHTPHIKLLITSHQRLHLPHEWLLLLPSLPQTAAQTLFRQHIQRLHRTASPPTPIKEQAIAALCQRLDGNPFAIITLATSARLIPLPDLQQQLQKDGLNLPELAPFLQKLKARWHNLPPQLQTHCTALAICAPHSTPTAVQTIGQLTRNNITQLIDAALLTHNDEQIQIPATWQQFVRQHSPPPTHIRQAHAQFYEAFLVQQLNHLRQQNQPTAIQQIRQAYENISTAWLTLTQSPHSPPHPAATWSLFHYHDISGQLEEAHRQFNIPTPLHQALRGWFLYQMGDAISACDLLHGQLLALPKEAVQNRLLVRCYTAVVLTALGDLDQATPHLQQAWTASQQIGDLWSNALTLNIAGDVAFARGQLHKANTLYQQSLTLKRIVKDDWGQAFCLMNLGHIAYAQTEYDTAVCYYQQASQLRQFIGDKRRTAASFTHLGHVARQTHTYNTARQHYRTSHNLYTTLGKVSGQIQTLLWLAHTHQDEQNHLEALQIYQQALTIAVRHQQQQKLVEILLTIHHLQIELTHAGHKIQIQHTPPTAVPTREDITLQNLLTHFHFLSQRHTHSPQFRHELQQTIAQLFPTTPPHLQTIPL